MTNSARDAARRRLIPCLASAVVIPTRKNSGIREKAACKRFRAISFQTPLSANRPYATGGRRRRPPGLRRHAEASRPGFEGGARQQPKFGQGRAPRAPGGRGTQRAPLDSKARRLRRNPAAMPIAAVTPKHRAQAQRPKDIEPIDTDDWGVRVSDRQAAQAAAFSGPSVSMLALPSRRI